MKSKTYKNITRRILRGIDPRIIEEVNRLMDNPEPWMPTYSPELGGMPGLDYRGHRRKGHDLLTAMIIGLRAGGLEGAAAAFTHLGLDSARDQVVKEYGAEGANLLEAGLNLAHALNKKSKKRNKKRSKRSSRQSQ
jgi:hypothetical protein